MSIGEVIKVLMKKKGITQVELAGRIGKSRTAISQILNGGYNPNPDTLDKISKVLEVPVPMIHFMAISEDDIPEEKRAIYKMLQPSMEKYLFEIFAI